MSRPLLHAHTVTGRPPPKSRDFKVMAGLGPRVNTRRACPRIDQMASSIDLEAGSVIHVSGTNLRHSAQTNRATSGPC